MAVQRVAIIFDSVQRPETTGGYCLRALKSLVEVEHFQPSELDRIPRAGFDLYLNIDDGLRYHLPPELRPSAWGAIDTHMDFAWCLHKSRGFDLVFAAQRDGAEQLCSAGVPTAAWLPLACDPEIHAKHVHGKRYEVAFVGNVFPGPRGELLEVIRLRYLRTFIGQRYFEDMARTYSSAHIVFNRSIKNDVNMRVFEAMSCGSLLLTNDLSANGQAELFRDGVHLATYTDREDLLDKLSFYLERESLREKIAAAGRAEVLDKHTYLHRMERLLRETEVALSRTVVAPRPAHRQDGADADRARPSTPSDHQDSVYFGHARPEVLALIPTTARAVLDIGCGAGRLGEALKARQPAEVVGVELNETAAAAARGRIDYVLTGDVEQLELNLPSGRFGAIVCGDILEHLREPERLLRIARTWLAADGCLIASIPNVRHHGVVGSLLGGNWTYESAGLLDRTHLRFFTRREIEKLFFRAGFAVDEMKSIIAPGDDEALRAGNGCVRLGRLSLSGLSDQEMTEYFTYQYLVRARRAAAPDRGMTSIVIVTHNQLEYTRQCLDSVRRLTDEPYELIVVDNGSSDGTVDYLRSFPEVRLIANAANAGFPAAANQGIAAAGGSQILLLNNDVIVTTGWLCRLLRALASDPAIGLVGPCSNFVSGPQQVAAGYDTLCDLDGFAWDWGGANDGRIVDAQRLVGFCLLIRRAVVETIGLLDEQFGAGCFDDDDYCLRAIQAGYRAVIAADAFVHHFGGRTFVGSGVDFGPIMRENERRFREKWSGIRWARSCPDSGRVGESPHQAFGHPLPARGRGEKISGPCSDPDCQGVKERAGASFSLRVSPGGGLVVERSKAETRLSLCMIVRDSAHTLPACLESIRPWVDEMVIVDTGSVDETPRIVESFGGRLFHFPWCDDFSAARNESLRHAKGDWLFWMDSDDTIPPECGRMLPRLADQGLPSNVVAYVMQVHCPGSGENGEPATDVTVVDHVKLFRNCLELRFDGRIHEQILPAIRACGGDVAWTDIYVVHSGSDQSPLAQAKKRERDLRILGLELAERPEHPFTLFNLGMTHVHGSEYALAVDYLRRGIARSGPVESHLRKAFALLVYALMRLGRHHEALETCRQGRSMFARDTELRFREGVLLHELGRLGESRQAYLDVLGLREERHFASVDRALTGFKVRQNLAVVAGDMGDLAEAERQWREVVREVPPYRAGWRGLAETLLRGGRHEEVSALAVELQNDRVLCAEGLLIESRTAIKEGRFADARAMLDRAIADYPDDLETLRGRGQFLFEHGSAVEAENALQALIDHDPDDASAHHNLGTLRMRTQRYDQAVEAYRRSLSLRPHYAATHLNLGYALKDSGRLGEAVAEWEQTLRLAPGDPAALQQLILMGRSSARMGG